MRDLKKLIRCCNICNGEDFVITKIIENYVFGICCDCGHVFQLSNFLDSHYLELPYTTQRDNYAQHASNRAQYILDFIEPYIWSGQLNGLDIGAGMGGVSHFLEQHSSRKLKMTGITVDVEEPMFKTDAKILFGDFMTYEFKDRFDIIVMSHILEHFPNPVDAMLKVRELCHLNSKVYVEVPSFYWAEVRVPSVYTPEHLSFFHKGSLKNVFAQSGFNVIEIKESKVWGNIKVVLSPTWISKTTFMCHAEFKEILRNKKRYSWLYNYYRLKPAFCKVKPND